MRQCLVSGLIALSLILGVPPGARAINYTFLPFPDDPSATPGTTHARGINNAGQISGWELLAGSPIGFVRAANGTFQEINVGEVGTRINGINNNGVVVGASLLNPDSRPSAFVLPPGGPSAGVGIPLGFSTRDEAFGINDNYPLNNSIVGTLTNASNGKVQGFQTPSAAVTIFPGPSGVVSTQMFGVSNNQNGRLFVGTLETSPGVFQGFFQTGPDIASSELITVAGASRTDAFGTQLNSPFNIPAVVGEYTVGGVNHGFLLPAGNGDILSSLQTIDSTAPGAKATRLFGINDSGQIVGEFDSSSTHGFFLTPFSDIQKSAIEICLRNPGLCDLQIQKGTIEDPTGGNAINCNAFPALCGSVSQILTLLEGPNPPPASSFILVSTPGAVSAPEPSTLLLLGFGLVGLGVVT